MNHKMGNVVPVLLLLGCLGIAASGCADGTGDADDPHAETTDTGAPLTDDHGTTATPDGQEGQDGHDGHDGHDGQDDQPRFYSAARAGAGAYYGGSVDAGASMDAGAPASDASATRSDGATVEEGDIYRVLADDRILNLNSYRGLQVLDVADTSNPTIIGRLKVTGTPVEMYVVGDRAVVLLNNWRGYYGEVGVPGVDTFQGGLMLLVDISDPTAPSVLDQSRVHGYIRTSRMVYDAESIAVYVAAHGYQDYGYGAGGASPGDYQGPTTVVQSYAITAGGGIEARSRLDLGGYVFDIQATPRVLMVAHTEWHDGEVSSRVSVVDISSASGAMVEGDDVTVKGRVSSKHNMSYYKGVLRVVSGGTDWQARTNHVETFDATDLTDISPVDHKTFGDGEDLYATLFLGNKAFFVTYLRVDPFHAFEITDEGFITERFEFIVSGWNDFFRPVFEETRLIGIGVDDARGNRNMAVSLYDITDLGNPEPMITRADVRASGSTWSEALWDDRAFSVLEGAVEATAEDGETVETGMVLLPFSGWDRDRQRYVAAVQIFTFSPGTLTQRGYMEHGTPVRRSFLAKPSTPANLSEQDLSLFNCADPDSPEELGRVELSPSYSDFFVRGDYGVRFKDSVNHYYYPGGSRERDRPPAELETVIRDGDPDTSETVAEVEVPAGSRLIKAGDMVVAVASRYQVGDYVTSVVVYDYSDPASPKAAGTLETDELSQGHYYRYDGYHDVACYDCGWWDNYGSVEAYPVGRNVVFVERTGERKLLGQEEVCRTYPDRGASYPRPTPGGNMTGTTWYSGSITCRSLDGAEPVCTGEIQRCTYTSETEFDCQPVDPDTIETRESCYTNERTRYWWRFTFHLLDLSDPNAPTLTGAVELPAEQEADSVFVEGDSVYASWL